MVAPSRSDLIPQNLAPCICMANKSPCDLCCDRLCFLDEGIRVVFKPKRNEVAVAVALDGCVFRDNQKKCDGMFVLSRTGQIYVLLVELKGSHIDDAFEQIFYVAKHRQEYADVISGLAHLVPSKRQIMEKSFIVSTGSMNRNDQQKLENTLGIRPKIITVEKPASAAPDLRQYL
jgi:hypothetical protein